ncbi:hypothetical protein DsansV1_C24g0180971 [Dioscorea sansibarensis]
MFPSSSSSRSVASKSCSTASSKLTSSCPSSISTKTPFESLKGVITSSIISIKCSSTTSSWNGKPIRGISITDLGLILHAVHQSTLSCFILG